MSKGKSKKDRVLGGVEILERRIEWLTSKIGDNLDLHLYRKERAAVKLAICCIEKCWASGVVPSKSEIDVRFPK